ncbi:MAG: MFS transporter, partial [Paludibacteraceae bacterium]|nr:MFS transporter [Paludibacteraceae bacterium]
IGAFVSGFTMCILNCVVNPMLNLLGGGGNKGNQLIQIGGVFNSSAAVAVYIIMGALIGDATKAHIADATPALMIALAIFVIGFVTLLFTKIEEPEQAPVDISLVKGAMKYRHFVLGVIAIFLYMGVEVGTPTYILQYLTSPEMGMDASIVGLIVAVYWLMMLVGRFVGGAIGSKVSSRAMITTVSAATLVLVAFGMFAPTNVTVNVPGIDWANLNLIWAEVPVGIFAFLLVGLCTSVMWGGIFNMAVEGLGKYTAIASGKFMTMVFGCAVMVAIQGYVADLTDYMTSYWVVLFCAAYILFYALIGSKNVNKD